MNDARHNQDRISGRRGSTALIVSSMLVAGLIAVTLGSFLDPVRRDFAGEDYLPDISFDLQFMEYVVLDAKAELLEETRDVQVLGIGDSSCQFGFSPSALSAATGMSALNLGTFGTVGVSGHEALLDRALSQGIRPECVLLWVHPHTLVQSAEEESVLDQGQWLEQRIESGSARSDNRLARVNDTFGGGLRLTVLDHAGWREQPLLEPLTPATVRQRILDDRGWFAALPQNRPRQYKLEDLHPDALAGLTRIQERCAQAGIPLFLAVMPRMIGGAVDAERYGELVRAIRGSVPGAHWVESISEETPWSEMQSPTHFAKNRAELVSSRIGLEIARVLGRVD